MVSTRKTATRPGSELSGRSRRGPATALTMLIPSSPKIPATPARVPGRSGMTTSRRLPGSCAPMRYTSASITSEEEIMPTSASPSTTGRQPTFFSRIAFAASSMGSSGRAVVTSLAMISETTILPRASARAGSPRAGVAERRSRSETIPTSPPPSKTGRCLMRLSRQRASASPAVACGGSTTTSWVIASFTSSIRAFPEDVGTFPVHIVYEPIPSGTVPSWYKGAMPEQLNQFLAERAGALVRENFTGVRADWWWERRMGGGIEVCQELDPESMSREISARTGKDLVEVRRVISEELGLEDMEPVVLTFEIAGKATADEAAKMLAERSSTPEGLAAGLYSRIEEAAERGSTS